MPGMTGIEVLEAPRPKALDTCVIVLKVYGAMEDATQARNLGICDFLIKTIDLEGVELVINRALKHLLQRPGASNNSQPTPSNQVNLCGWIASNQTMKVSHRQMRGLVQDPSASILLLGKSDQGKNA